MIHRAVAGLLAIQIAAPSTLPAAAVAKLQASLRVAAPHSQHLWRDHPPMESTLVNAYIEIPLGDRAKFELDMAKNKRALDRMVPEHIGGYPVNYGFVPQTVSYDGDPFDALVLGPAQPAGTFVRGVVVGIMHMEDEKGIDSKVVLSRVGADGRALDDLTEAVLERLADFFNRYKRDDGDPETYATVTGWGTAALGRSFVQTTHAFFKECRERVGGPCQLK